MMQVITAFGGQLNLSSLLTHQGTSQFNPHLHRGVQQGKNSSFHLRKHNVPSRETSMYL